MSELSLYFLGPWHATLAGEPLTHFRYDRARALLAYLAVEGDRPHRREALLGLFWPELPEAAARNNLRQVLHALRQALGDRGGGGDRGGRGHRLGCMAEQPYVIASRSAVQFNPEADVELDVSAFAQLVEGSNRHAHRSAESCHACAARLEEAVALYRGPFLADFSLADSIAFEEWAVVKREWLNQLMLSALSRLAAYHERRGQYEAARRTVQQELALEPWREAAHRTLMRLYMLEGARGAALAQYEDCRRLLEQELGVEPELATTALYERIRDASEETPIGLPPLALPTQRPHTLPLSITSFVGREAELAEIGRLMGDEKCRLLTLAGPGGVGKSRLALQAATEQLDLFRDGVFFTPLATQTSTDLLSSALAHALGLELAATDEPDRVLLNWLRDRELLLLLDNFEQLLPDGAELLRQIVHAAPDVRLLVTSRERLNLQGEWVFAVSGLPGAHERGATHEGVELGDSEALFLERGRRARHDFQLTAENREQIVRICQLLGGLPLAIEFAAAWVQTLSCGEILSQIEEDIAFLTTNLRDVPERHRSLRAVLEHTWRSLTVEERHALARLSAFRGGFRHRAAEEVAEAGLEMLRRLTDKSLVQRDPGGRYHLHELLHRYAAERLEADGAKSAIEQRHLSFFLQLAETAVSQLRGPNSAQSLARLEAERDNLHAALERGLAGDGVILDDALPLAAALWQFWYRRGYLREGRQWMARALNRTNAQTEAALRAALHHGAGVLAWNQGHYTVARTHYEQGLAIRRGLGDEQGVAALLNNLGNLALDRGDYVEARAWLDESLTLKRRMGDRAGIAASLSNLGVVAYEQGDFDAACAYLDESVALKRELGDQTSAAIPLGTLGAIAVEQGDFDQARIMLEESLQLKREVGDRWGIAMTLADLAALATCQEELRQARSLLLESLELRRQLGDRWSLAHSLEMTGRLALLIGSVEQAARLWGAAAKLRADMGAPMTASDERHFLGDHRAAVEQLGDARYEAAFAEGQALALEEAIACAQCILEGAR